MLFSQAAYDDAGTESATRLQLREDKAEATWRTTVTAARSAAGTGAVCVDLECFSNTTQTLRPSKSRLVRDLVGELEPRDGVSRLSVNALRVTHDRVNQLVDVLCAPERQLPVVVAARPVQPDPLWSKRVASTMVVETWFDTMDDLNALFFCENWLKTVDPDHKNFVDLNSFGSIISEEEVVVG
ncbi:ethyl tert-butyl ether degradation protein EthD [Streptomyces sp. PRh5]|nr:ethyl tert-butyl ether degradation protein EthD [Streptomyces sp. PRh5]